MEVIRSQTAGFCMGVVLALQKLDNLLAIPRSGPIYTLGPIIHNPQVLEKYAARGVIVAGTLEEIGRGATVVIRAHGIPKPTREKLRLRGAQVVDATCPKVRKAQRLIAGQSRQGRMLLLYGEESHPEVKGLLSYAEAGACLFDSLQKVVDYPLEKDRRYCLAAQTTQDRETFNRITEELLSRKGFDINVLPTICDATRRRQEEAVRIAREVDFMIVAGGLNSGNTRRLAQVVAAQGTPVVHVETADDLPLERLAGVSRVGLTAGASTPGEITDDIEELLLSMEKSVSSAEAPTLGWRDPSPYGPTENRPS